ncbi:TadE/TadG family type IV pilus assembly protein [Actibacterium pelagium]|nr:hypothetical protein [Actibacterium pelagium]
MISASIKSFLRSEDGAVTVESILWVLFFFTVFVSILDICVYFTKHGWAIRALHQENRKYIVGEYTSCSKLEAELGDRVRLLSPSATVKCEKIPHAETDLRISQVTMTLIGRELGLGMWTFFVDGVSVQTSGIQVIEHPDNAADDSQGTS